MVPLMIATALNPLNSSSLATALTPIDREFNDPAGAAWLLAAVYLSAAIFLPVFGRTADMFGAKRTLIFGTVIVAIGGVMGAFAPNMSVLIVSRAVIGMGTSAGYPCAMAMLRARAQALGVTPPNRTLAFLSVSSHICGMLGPPLGGFVLALLGWRWIFLVNLPLALIGLLTMRALPADPPPRRVDISVIDLPGMALFAGGIAAMTLFLMSVATRFDPWTLGISAAFLAALVVYERRLADPFIDVRMLARNGALALVFLRQTINGVMMYGLFYSIPQWMQASKGLPPAQVGLMMLPYSMIGTITTFALARPKWAPARPFINAFALLAVAGGMFLLQAGLPTPAASVFLGFCGMATAALGMWNQQSLLRHAPPDQTGAAAGLFRTTQYVGAMLAAVLIGMVMHRGADDGSMRLLALIYAPMLLVVLALTAFDRPERHAA